MHCTGDIRCEVFINVKMWWASAMIRAGVRAFALKLLLTFLAIIVLDQTFRKHILSSPGKYEVCVCFDLLIAWFLLQMKLLRGTWGAFQHRHSVLITHLTSHNWWTSNAKNKTFLQRHSSFQMIMDSFSSNQVYQVKKIFSCVLLLELHLIELYHTFRKCWK